VAADEPEQLVRRAYEAWNASGPSALMPFVTDDIELMDAPELPDAGSWTGRNAVLRRLTEVADAVGGHSGDLESFEAHNHLVLVAMTWRRDSDPEGQTSLGRVFHLVRAEGGRIARITVFLDEAAARHELSRSGSDRWN
jgi:ketosteroid isomerase-like protein